MPRYRIFGLLIGSESPLLELDECDATDDEPDVIIRYGKVPEAVGTPVLGLTISSAGAILDVPDVGRYLISNGRDIVIDRAPAANDRNVRLYLLGSALGALLHQRRMLPLHANIIALDDVAVAFMGHSGAGKSTLANWFADRGVVVLGDDVCVVCQDKDTGPRAIPGLPRIRLWQDALVRSGRRAEDYTLSFDGVEKYDIPSRVSPTMHCLPLAAIYLLEVAPPDCTASIVAVAGMAATAALIENTYRGLYLPLLGGTADHLEQCLSLARGVPIFRFRRRWGYEAFDEEAKWVEAHARNVIASR